MGKKRKGSNDEGGGGGFMMMFVTLSLLLLAFFILLNSMATINQQKKRVALGSLLGSFGIMPGADSTENASEKSIKKSSLISGEGIYQMFKEIKREMELILSMNEIDKNDIDAEFDEQTGEIKIILAERLLFPAGEAVVSLRLFPLLDKTAAIARRTGGRVIVTGHTDSRKSPGVAADWVLSLKRGIMVARHLEAVGPLGKRQVSARGASHYMPIRNNDTESGRAANRRVEIQIRTKDKDY